MTLRPELHLVPESGILEAPAGVLLDGDTWHVFYQYRPSADEPSRWGHAYSEDNPFYWFECDDALAPAGGEVRLRAGAVTASAGAAHLYYTSVTSTDSTIAVADYADVSTTCEVHDDPRSLDAGVRRVAEVSPTVPGYSRFRSPCVVPGWSSADREHHEGWLMLALTGTLENPVPVVLHSPDGMKWDFDGPLTFTGDPQFPHEGAELPAVVSPRIIRLRDDVAGEVFDVLLVTIESVPGKHDEIAGYLVGRLHGAEFEVTTGFRRLDFGHDFTRPRNTNVTPGTDHRGEGYAEALLFGLLNGRGRADQPLRHHSWEEEGWANVLTLPRHVTLEDGVIYQTPACGLVGAVEESERARLWTGMLEVPEGSCVKVTLLDGNGNPATEISHSGDSLTLDRSVSRAFGGTYAEDKPAIAPLAEGDDDTLTIVVDGSTVEVYADSGLVTMSSRMYFEDGCSGFKVETTGEASISRSFERAGH